MRNFLKENWFKLFIVLIIIYTFGIYTYQEFRPKLNLEKVEDCLKLNTELGVEMCIHLITKGTVEESN